MSPFGRIGFLSLWAANATLATAQTLFPLDPVGGCGLGQGVCGEVGEPASCHAEVYSEMKALLDLDILRLPALNQMKALEPSLTACPNHRNSKASALVLGRMLGALSHSAELQKQMGGPAFAAYAQRLRAKHLRLLEELHASHAGDPEVILELARVLGFWWANDPPLRDRQRAIVLLRGAHAEFPDMRRVAFALSERLLEEGHSKAVSEAIQVRLKAARQSPDPILVFYDLDHLFSRIREMEGSCRFSPTLESLLNLLPPELKRGGNADLDDLASPILTGLRHGSLPFEIVPRWEQEGPREALRAKLMAALPALFLEFEKTRCEGSKGD